MGKKLIAIMLIAIAIKFFYFFFALTITELNSGYTVNYSESDFFSLFKRNDSGWYQMAAEQGYPKISDPIDLGYSDGKYYKQSVWAFFPLYPILIRQTENLLNLGFQPAAFLLSIIFSISCFIAFYLLCFRIFKINEKESFIYTLFFILFPFHYYYSMYYTEAIFFTFLAFSFLSIHIKKYWLTSILIIPLTLIRPNGIVCLIPLFIYYIETEGGFKKFYSSLKTFNLKDNIQVMWFLTSPIAFGIYCIYQKNMTGYYFAFAMAQAGWYKEFMFPLFALFRRGDFATQFNSVYTIVFMIFSIIAWKKFPLSMNILIWISILLPMASGSALSMPRFISTIFPMTIYFTSFCIKTKIQYLILLLAFSLQLLTFYPWLIGAPISF